MHTNNIKTRQLVSEFDIKKGIVHFTSSSKLKINSIRKLVYLYKKMDFLLKKHSHNRRLFMIIDFNSIIIELDFNKQIAPFFKKLTKKHLFPKGAIAYGTSMSRLTFKMTLNEINDNEERFFKTKTAAFEYMDSLIKEMNLKVPVSRGLKCLNDTLETIPIQLDKIEKIPTNNIPELKNN